MRVIAGIHRSRLLVSPRGTATRPTSDRLRETLFNVVAGRIEGCLFADLYAGTGAIGIEAMSRGASHVWFSENSPGALAAINQNLAALKITRNFTVEDRGTGALLQRLTKASKRIDIVFLDPPYEADAEYEGTLSFFGSVRGRLILSPNAFVIAEHSSKSDLAKRFGCLEHTRLIRQGDAALSFYKVLGSLNTPEL